MKPKKGDKIAVWFSCGAASAVAALITLRQYRDICDVRLIYNPVIEEHHDNLRFLKDCERALNTNIEFASNDKFPECSAAGVWEKRSYINGHAGAPCTTELKKGARQQWEDRNNPDWHVLGFTVEERKRYDRFILTERPNVLPILIERNITKTKCFEMIDQLGIKRPKIYEYGFPNANCIGCPKAQYGKDWNRVRKHFPKVFERRCVQGRLLGVRLWKVSDNDRRFLDELPEDYDDGQQTMNFECGIFCEEGSNA